MDSLFACVVAPLLFAGLAFAAPATNPATRQYGDDPLEELRDQRRVVVLVAADPNDVRLTRMNEAFRAASDGVSERQITVVRIVGGHGGMDEKTLSSPAVARILKRCDATADTPFLAVLIGKDGGVKLRETTPVEIDRLFGLIDSMPMRQREMKR